MKRCVWTRHIGRLLVSPPAGYLDTASNERRLRAGFVRLDIQLLTQRVCALIWTLTQISRRLNCATVVPLAQIAVWQATLTGRVRPPPEPNPLQLICPTLTSETTAGFHLRTRG